MRVIALSQECESALKSLFSEEVTQEEAGEFLQLQGDITLHRLAWTYLKAQKNDADENLQSVERTILELLNDKYTNTNADFIKAREAFEAQPSSRSTLADIAPYLKEALSHEYQEKDANFKLNASDLKLLSAIAKNERSAAVDGKYDHRLLDSGSPQGILNFMKVINSSYKISPNADEQDLQIEMKLTGLENVMANMQSKLSKFLNEIKMPTLCSEKDCTPGIELDDFFNQNEDVQNIFWESLAEKLESDDILLEKLSYGDLWLKVKSKTLKQKPVIAPAPAQNVKRAAKKPYSVNVPVREAVFTPAKIPSLNLNTGVLVEDPLSIIVKDLKGRSAAEFEKLDPKLLSAMSQAILRGDKVFVFQDKFFDRKTGRQLSITDTVKLLSQSDYQILQQTMARNSEIRDPLLETLTNGRKSFVYKNQLMDVNGNVLDPHKVIAEEMSKKLALSIEPNRYKGMQTDYLVLRAHALKNNQPYFVFENKTYDSFSGYDSSSPFRKLAGADAKIDKSKRLMMEKLGDKELIRNFHRDNPDQDCGYYGVLDKKGADLKIFQNDGKEVYRSEVLVGSEVSDQRTRWTKYTPTERIPSSSTGAGIFTIRPQVTNDQFNQKNFNNNILSFKDESKQDTVFAIHQIPVNMNSRYSRFGTNDPEDRRISGGCANLKLSDFKAIKKWLGNSCKVYVLPEEKGNKFIISDNKLKLVAASPIAANRTNLYNYSSLNTKPRPIRMKVVDKLADTNESREFIKALEDEKEKLMRLYKLTNDEYNDLALLSFGILGNESNFGLSERYRFKELTVGQATVIGLRFLASKDDVFNTSRGLTQIKNLPNGVFTKAYPEITKDNLGYPKNSAVATIAFLAEAATTMRKIAIENQSDPSKLRITRENMMDYMGYLYQGGSKKLKATDPTKQATPELNAYYRKLKRNMTYVELTQKIE